MKSMAAFAQGRQVDAAYSLSVSIRSSGHRQAEWTVRGLGVTPLMERMVRQELGACVRRGRVEVTFDLFLNDARHWEVQFNDYLAGEILRRVGPVLKPHRDFIRLDGDSLLRIPMLFHLDPLPETLGEETMDRVTRFFKSVLADWDGERVAEGSLLRAEIEGLLARCGETCAALLEGISGWEAAMMARGRERVCALLKGRMGGDEARLQRELVLEIEKGGTRELCRRLRIHLERLTTLLQGTPPQGREGDSLAQEILRDLQVLGARLYEPEALSLAGSFRQDVEQLRQLFQNVE